MPMRRLVIIFPVSGKGLHASLAGVPGGTEVVSVAVFYLNFSLCRPTGMTHREVFSAGLPEELHS
jgi:hypothetical protein